jgi:N-acetylneuraminic acid mutarotase
MESFVMGDNLYMFSGNLSGGVHNNTVYKYYPETNTWTDNEVSNPKIFRYNPVNLMIANKLYYGGGDNNGNQTSLWVYDPSLE